MPSWLDGSFALGFFLGCLVAACVYAIDWYWHVKVRPKRADERAQLKDSKPDKTLTGKLYERDRERHPEEYAPSPPSSSLMGPSDPQHDLQTAAIEEQSGLPTKEHPAPKTSMIDFRQSPPPPPPGYTGPERRLRSDNPYPELRRRAEDRERYEDEVAKQPPKPTPPPVAPRMTRAEERRLREAQSTEGERTDTDGE